MRGRGECAKQSAEYYIIHPASDRPVLVCAGCQQLLAAKIEEKHGTLASADRPANHRLPTGRSNRASRRGGGISNQFSF